MQAICTQLATTLQCDFVTVSIIEDGVLQSAYAKGVSNEVAFRDVARWPLNERSIQADVANFSHDRRDAGRPQSFLDRPENLPMPLGGRYDESIRIEA